MKKLGHLIGCDGHGESSPAAGETARSGGIGVLRGERDFVVGLRAGAELRATSKPQSAPPLDLRGVRLVLDGTTCTGNASNQVAEPHC